MQPEINTTANIVLKEQITLALITYSLSILSTVSSHRATIASKIFVKIAANYYLFFLPPPIPHSIQLKISIPISALHYRPLQSGWAKRHIDYRRVSGYLCVERNRLGHRMCALTFCRRKAIKICQMKSRAEVSLFLLALPLPPGAHHHLLAGPNQAESIQISFLSSSTIWATAT